LREFDRRPRRDREEDRRVLRRRGRQHGRQPHHPDGAAGHPLPRRHHRRPGHLHVPADLQARLGHLLTAMSTTGADLQACDELRGRLKWFLLGRVSVIRGFPVMVAVARRRAGRAPFDLPLDQLLPIVMVIYAFSALSAILLPHLRRPNAFAYVQIAVDVLLVSGVIWLTGGLDSPFAFLYSLPIINAAVLLFEGGALFAPVCAALSYDGLLAALARNTPPLPPPHPSPPT